MTESPTGTALEEALIGWLPQQRWFGAKGRPVASVGVREAPLVNDGELSLLLALVDVAFDDGGSDLYQVPLSSRVQQWGDIEHALVAVDRDRWYYDAPHDPDAAGLLLRLLREQATVGDVSFHRIGEVGAGLHPRLVGAEQSNTSLVYGEELIVKWFRRVSAGLNPDLELTRALQEAGSTHVAPIQGWVEGRLAGELCTLAVAQSFQRSASEGWQLATTSVRDLYAEADLHAGEVGGDFARESERLGAATAEVHGLLAQALPSALASAAEAEATAVQMHERLDQAVAEVSRLAAYTGPLHAAYDAVAALGEGVATQRIHGDYHLGQVLRTDTGWLLLDFEGEPARPLSERTALMSPVRDVAGMLRSFDYAARYLLTDHPASSALEYRAGEWAERNRGAFCEGYAAVAGRDPRSDRALLRAFELDKAVYEVVYEARHRPSWLPIPLGSIQRLVA